MALTCLRGPVTTKTWVANQGFIMGPKKLIYIAGTLKKQYHGFHHMHSPKTCMYFAINVSYLFNSEMNE